MNKVDDFFLSSFNNCINLFHEMKGYYYNQSSAKKLIEVLNNIIFLLTGKQESEKKQYGGGETKKTGNVNLLDMVNIEEL